MGTDLPAEERIAALERALEEKDRRIAEQEFQLARFGSMIEAAPVGVFQVDAQSSCTYVNESWCKITGMSAEQALGGGWSSLFHPEDIARLLEIFEKSVAAGLPFVADYRIIRPDSEVRWVHGQSNPLIGPKGEFLGYVGAITDITEHKHFQDILEERIRAAQDALIRELSTPLVILGEGVVAMPLVGSIGEERAAQILDTLLTGIQEQRAAFAILDITGVTTVDTHAANALIHAARAARLLGVEVVISGIGPSVASTFVVLGVDLTQIPTMSTLQAGLAYALRRMGKRLW